MRCKGVVDLNMSGSSATMECQASPEDLFVLIFLLSSKKYPTLIIKVEGSSWELCVFESL